MSTSIEWTDETKWCTACKARHPRAAFGRDRSRGDGLAARCLDSRHTGRPRGWQGRRPTNPRTGRPGPAPAAARDEDRRQARARVNLLVRTGRMPRPESLPCSDCGHTGEDRRHEYHHHKGYAAAHHLDVVVLCSLCHGRHHAH